MITCKNCNTQLDDGSRFCYVCGTEVTPEQIPVPNQTPIPNQSQMSGQMPEQNQMPAQNQIPAPNQMPEAAQGQVPYPAQIPAPMGAPVQPGTMKPAKAAKSNKLVPAIIIAVAAVAVIVIAAVLLPRVFTKNSSNINAALYLKDGEINYTPLSSMKPRELTQKLYQYGLADPSYGSFLGYTITFSKDGKRVFYPDRMSDDDNGLTIYYMNLKSKDSEGVKVDSGINVYKINDAGTRIYYLKGEDNNFYVSNLEDREKIDSKVNKFYINSDGSKIIYSDNDGSIYYKEGKKDREKIDSNASIEYVSEDLSTVYYLKNNALYQKKLGKDKEKLFSDVSNVVHIYDSGDIYYMKSQDITYNLSDFVNDDMAEADAAMVEPEMPFYPSYDDCMPDMPYPTEPDPSLYTDYWGYYDWDLYNQYYNEYYAQLDEYNAQWQANYDAAISEYEQAYNKYQEESERYYAKQDRDYLRQNLQETTIPVTNYALYYYDKKESILISDSCASYMTYSSQTPLIIYKSNNTAEIAKVNLSEVTSFDSLYSTVSNNLLTQGEVYAAIKATNASVPQENGTSYYVKDNGELLYYLDNYDSMENTYDLYGVKISNGKMDIPTKIDEDVYGFELVNGSDTLVYYKDVKNDAGDLYIDMKLVDSDVYTYSVMGIQGTDMVLYYVDYDSDTESGSLKIYDGKNTKKIGDDIVSYNVIDESNILYLMDYDFYSARGDLYLYNGTDKKKQIDTDVTALILFNPYEYNGDISYIWHY